MAENTMEGEGKTNDLQLMSSSDFPLLNQLPDGIFPLKKQQRIHEILSGIDLFKDSDYSDILENPFNTEDYKRIEEIMDENTSSVRNDSTASSLQLKMDTDTMERLKRIDELLDELKADGHAHIKNIASTKFKSKCTKTMITLDELKADMNKIDQSLVANRKNREAENNKDIVNEKSICE